MRPTLFQLESGELAEITLADLSTLTGKSRVTLRRRIKSGKLIADQEEGSNRFTIKRENALAFINSPKKHVPNFQDSKALAVMEYARAFKGNKSA